METIASKTTEAPTISTAGTVGTGETTIGVPISTGAGAIEAGDEHKNKKNEN